MNTDRWPGAFREGKPALTPMIDVTFLLLIFLMLLPLRSLERRVSAQLPGPGRWCWGIPPVSLPKIEVKLIRIEGELLTRVEILDRSLGWGENAFKRLDDRLVAIHATNRDLCGHLHATAEVPHRDVIRCIDAFKKAGVEKLEFRGAPPPGRERERDS